MSRLVGASDQYIQGLGDGATIVYSMLSGQNSANKLEKEVNGLDNTP